MRVRVGRALVRGAGLGLAAGLGYSLYQSEGDISNIGAVRSVRLYLKFCSGVSAK